jgi:hypothetical protein
LGSTDVLGIVMSDDLGDTWSGPRVGVIDPHRHLINSIGAPLVASSGELLLPYFAFAPVGFDNGRVPGELWLARWRSATPTRIGEWRVWANRGNLELATLGLAVGNLGRDRSTGPRAGRVYATWLSLLVDRYQVFVAHSHDEGSSWSEAMRVNDDTTTAHHGNPGLAVSASGAVGVVWNDRRADPASQCFETRFSASLDGGESFLPSVALSTLAACPPPGPDDSRQPFRFLNGGDTQGIVGLAGDQFVVVWIGDGRIPGGPWMPRSTRIRVER